MNLPPINKVIGFIDFFERVSVLFLLKQPRHRPKASPTKAYAATQNKNCARFPQGAVVPASWRHLEKIAAVSAVNVDNTGGADPA
ncbi:MAG TPA: hypothetical protein VLT36_02710 [Candidatus Dormibacteraeota bacterium]|nr:hypothetical protein [Candidatus Dormibacteraeota bacterium]